MRLMIVVLLVACSLLAFTGVALAWPYPYYGGYCGPYGCYPPPYYAYPYAYGSRFGLDLNFRRGLDWDRDDWRWRHRERERDRWDWRRDRWDRDYWR
jgi:hypothetical protein